MTNSELRLAQQREQQQKDKEYHYKRSAFRYQLHNWYRLHTTCLELRRLRPVVLPYNSKKMGRTRWYRWPYFRICFAWWLIAMSLTSSVALAQTDPPGDSGEQSTIQSNNAVTAESVQVRRVKINFYINSIYDIDAESGTFAVDFWLDLYWRDPSLEGKTVDTIDTDTLWNPRVRPLNAKDVEILYTLYADSFEPDTNVYLSQRVIATFTNSFSLQRFPFDTQWLEMILESEEYDSNRLLFDFMGSDQAIIYAENPYTFPLSIAKYFSTEFALHEWTLDAANVVQQIHVLPYDKSSWAQFRIELEVKRIWRPYMLKIMLVFLFIMVLGATVFAIEIGELRYRLLHLLTLLLTAIIFNFTRLQVSPRIPYLTALDLQALLSYLLLGLAIGAVVLLALLNKRGNSTNARWLNLVVVASYIGLVLLCNLGLFVWLLTF